MDQQYILQKVSLNEAHIKQGYILSVGENSVTRVPQETYPCISSRKGGSVFTKFHSDFIEHHYHEI